MFLDFSPFLLSFLFFSNASSDLEGIGADVVFMDSFSVVLHCVRFVKPLGI